MKGALSTLALCALIFALYALAPLLAGAQAVAPYWSTEPPSRYLTVPADKVHLIDGDTIRVHGESLRLLGIDTPETRGARCAEERRRGLAAKWLLRHLIDAAGSVVIELRGTGRFGRPLALVWWGDLSLADALVGAGLARLYRVEKGRLSWCRNGE